MTRHYDMIVFNVEQSRCPCLVSVKTQLLSLRLSPYEIFKCMLSFLSHPEGLEIGHTHLLLYRRFFRPSFILVSKQQRSLSDISMKFCTRFLFWPNDVRCYNWCGSNHFFDHFSHYGFFLKCRQLCHVLNEVV